MLPFNLKKRLDQLRNREDFLKIFHQQRLSQLSDYNVEKNIPTNQGDINETKLDSLMRSLYTESLDILV